MGATTTRLTFEEFERLPEQPGKRELLRGELIELSPAELNHNRIAYRLCKRLDAAVVEAHGRGEAAELGEACMEMGYRLTGDGWVQPDVSVSHSEQREGKYFLDAPAIAIEVVSPGNSADDLDAKIELYFQFGALEVWLVYPKMQKVTVYAGGESRVVRANETLTTPLLPAFAMTATEIIGEE